VGFDFETSQEDIKVFLDEAEENLQVIEAGILRLEQDAEDPEVLQEIFRAAHTLKGSSATLGHKKMAEVTHAMENVLDKLRKGRLFISTAVTDALFASLDLLKVYKEEIATGVDSGVQTGEILALLGAVGETGAPVPASPAASAAGASPVGGTPAAATVPVLPLAPAEEAILAKGREEGLTPYLLQIELDPSSPMPAVRAFQTLLAVGDLGQLVRSWPTQEEVEEDRIGKEVKLLFLTAQPEAAIRTTLAGIPEITITLLQPYVPVAAPAPSAAPSPGQNAAAAIAAPVAEGPHGAPDGGHGPIALKGGRNSRTVRVDVEILDNLMNLVGELVIDRTRLLQVLTELEAQREGDELTQVMSAAVAHIGRMTADLQDQIQRARMLPVETLFRKFPRMVRDTAQIAGKEVEFTILGEETELDRSVIEEIGDPLMHLLRNAVDHGLEAPADRVKLGKPSKGSVRLEAYHEENHIIISVKDDGRGMDPARIRASAVRKGLLTEEAARRLTDEEAINLIWQPGFSTAEKVSEVSGRGVGLDVVHKNIERLNGSVEVTSVLGKGTEFRIKLPLTLAIIRSLQVQVAGTTYCLPLGAVVETDRIPSDSIQTVRGRQVIVKRGEVIPLIHLMDAFLLEREPGWTLPEELFIVIVTVMNRHYGIVVDNLIGEGDVVIKPLGKFIGDVPGISGATIMGDGDVAIILDISSLINTVQSEWGKTGLREA
jgi:two-component system chemotaxis sensor kinase CheA